MEDHDPSPLTGEDLRRMPKRAGLTRAELAQRFGCDRRTIVRWEKGIDYNRPVTVQHGVALSDRQVA